MKVGSGLKVTVPFAFTVYTPSPATVTVVWVQDGAVSKGEIPHNLRVLKLNGAVVSGSSFASTLMIWFLSKAPDEISFRAFGIGRVGGGIVS